MPILQTSTISNQNISSALLVGTYTATRELSSLKINVMLDQIAGNGDYTVYLTRQLAGAGSAYKSAVTTIAAASGVTSLVATSLEIAVNSGDVVKVYVTGLAGDTTTPDITCEFFTAAAWDYATATLTVAGTIGKLVADGVAAFNTMIALFSGAYRFTAAALGLSPISTATVAITSTTARAIANGDASITTYSTFEQAFTSTITADLSSANVTYAIKLSASDLDPAAILLIDKTTGLKYVNGAAPVAPVVAGSGSITIGGSSGAWTITVRAESAVTGLLTGYCGKYPNALKYDLGSNEIEFLQGQAEINLGVIRAI